MSLKQWQEHGCIRPHKTSPQEIAGLLAIVERDLADARGDISSDWKFGIAYNAALKLCTIIAMNLPLISPVDSQQAQWRLRELV